MFRDQIEQLKGRIDTLTTSLSTLEMVYTSLSKSSEADREVWKRDKLELIDEITQLKAILDENNNDRLLLSSQLDEIRIENARLNGEVKILNQQSAQTDQLIELLNQLIIPLKAN